MAYFAPFGSYGNFFPGYPPMPMQMPMQQLQTLQPMPMQIIGNQGGLVRSVSSEIIDFNNLPPAPTTQQQPQQQPQQELQQSQCCPAPVACAPPPPPACCPPGQLDVSDPALLQQVDQIVQSLADCKRPMLRRQVITVPACCQGRVATITRRLPTPPPDIIERITVIKPPRDVVNLCIEKPCQPGPCFQQREVCGKPRKPLIQPKIIPVAPRTNPCPEPQAQPCCPQNPQIQPQPQAQCCPQQQSQPQPQCFAQQPQPQPQSQCCPQPQPQPQPCGQQQFQQTYYFQSQPQQQFQMPPQQFFLPQRVQMPPQQHQQQHQHPFQQQQFNYFVPNQQPMNGTFVQPNAFYGAQYARF